MNSESDTIAAIATPPGRGAVAMVRVSGAAAQAVLTRVFIPRRPVAQFVSHRLYAGYVHCGGQRRDEVMAVLMRGPRSYTREDVAEVYTHGGTAAVRGVLDAVLQNGARPAQPGEFTQRAFLRGRMDLAQAEAVMQLINAKTDAARDAGLRQLGGGLSHRVNGFRDRILTCLAHIELSIDYPEHASEAMNLREVEGVCAAVLADVRGLLSTARAGRLLTEGLRCALLGRPNVGKSSLYNAILREDRAIVTEIPGTTRDVLCEAVSVQGLPLLLSDTAGVRPADEPIERMGVEKSLQAAGQAELVLFVADGSQPPQPEDAALWGRFADKARLLLLNKSDLPAAPGWESYPEAIPVSAKTHAGLDDMYARIDALFAEGLPTDAREADIVTQERHAHLLRQAAAQLEAAAAAIAAGTPEDLIAIDLKAAYLSLGELVGAAVGDDVTERIFSAFCVGK